jgi:sugar phosphate isomerase/epimerase
LTIGGTNFGYLNACTLAESLAHMASCGIEVIELGLAAPHFDLHVATAEDISALRDELAFHQLVCSSVNAAELNLISQNEAVAQLAIEQYTRLIEVAADLGVPRAVIVPGRQHPLRPTPHRIALDRFERHITALLRVAERCNVEIALETVPFGFLETGGELAQWVRSVGHPSLSMVVDCANVFMVEDPAAAIVAARAEMSLCHVSDAWKARWATPRSVPGNRLRIDCQKPRCDRLSGHHHLRADGCARSRAASGGRSREARVVRLATNAL